MSQHTPWDDIEGHPYGKDYKPEGVRQVKADIVPPAERYAVVEGNELADLYRVLGTAVLNGRAVRFTVHGGLKVDAGEGWTASMGRPADETGH